MAGIAGNRAWLGFAKQSAKGSPAANPVYRVPFSGGSIAPVRETDNLEETDSSRERGDTYVVTSGVEGSPEFYARHESLGIPLLGVLGAKTTTGTGPYVHEFTAAATLPYLTFWRDIGDLLYERYTDCFISQLQITADAGQPLACTANVQGLSATRLTSDPSGSSELASGAPFSFNEAAVTLGGASTRLISSFELTIDNNVTRQQTDDVTPYDVVAGTLEVSIGFNLIFESLAEYNKFHYGGSSGTTISPDIFTTDANFVFTKSSGEELEIDLPAIAYEEFPVEPDTGGDPIVVAVRATSQRSDDEPITVTLTNDVTSY